MIIYNVAGNFNPDGGGSIGIGGGIYIASGAKVYLDSFGRSSRAASTEGRVFFVISI
jgi:hypothetical protein